MMYGGQHIQVLHTSVRLSGASIYPTHVNTDVWTNVSTLACSVARAGAGVDVQVCVTTCGLPSVTWRKNSGTRRKRQKPCTAKEGKQRHTLSRIVLCGYG